MSEPIKRIEGWMESLEHRLGKLFHTTVPQAQAPAGREPVEYRVQALRDIAGQVQPTGRGSYFFPHAAVKVLLHDGALASAFTPAQFEADLAAELRERGVDQPVPVTLETVEQPGAPYEIEFISQARQFRTVSGERPRARLEVLAGEAAARSLEIERERIYIGRLAEVRGADGSITRRNDLAFDDSENTVSRRHASIQFDPASGRYRVYNDPECSLGTVVFREGSAIPADTIRGVQLRDQDELHLGNTRVRFRCDS